MAAALAHVERATRRDAMRAAVRARAEESAKDVAALRAEGGAATTVQAAARGRRARLERERRHALEAEAAATAAEMDAAAIVLQQAALFSEFVLCPRHADLVVPDQQRADHRAPCRGVLDRDGARRGLRL